MVVIFRVLVLLGILGCLASCKSKKVSLSGEDPVEVTDFIEFFPEKKLPYLMADTGLLRKENDSLLIGDKVFTQFVPDSILTKIFGTKVKPKIYPLGKVTGEETYLFAKALSGDKRVAYVMAFNKKNEFLAAMPLLRVDQLAATQQTATMDRGYSLTQNMWRKNADGSISDGKDVYVLNSEAGSFTLIMTDALDDQVTELINPIDTLSQKRKFTGDYGVSAMNIVSFRDGRKSDRLSFFIHFEKNKGECIGELKGEAVMKTATRAEYREPGDPCSIQFDFTSTNVSVKEVGMCGAHRGLRCSFEGRFTKKKAAKAKPKKK